MEPLLAVDAAELEIGLACRTLLAVGPDSVRTITVVLPGHDHAGAAYCLASEIAQRYGLDAAISAGRGSTRVRLMRRVPATSALPVRP